MSDEQQLIIALQLQAERYNRNFERSIAQTDRRFQQLEQRTERASRQMQSSMARAVQGMNGHLAGVGRNFAAVLAGSLTLQGAQRFIDSAVQIENSLKSAGLEGAELKKVYDDLFAAAQRNSTPIETLVQLYSRLSLNQRELGTNAGELVRFSETIAMALRAGGVSASEASGALLQLSQALGGSVVRAEEFNSILEGAPTILQAAAFGIKEAGGSVAALRSIMLEGQLSSEAFFRGIEAGAPAIAERLEGAERTISASMTNLFNALTDAAGEFNNSSEAANTFGQAIDNLAAYIEGVNFDTLIGEVQRYIEAIANGIRMTQNFALELGRITGLENVGRFLEGSAGFRALGLRSTANLRDRMQADGYEGSADLEAYIGRNYADRGDRAAPADVPARQNFTSTPITLADFPVKGEASGAKKRAGGGGGGGRDRAAAQAEREAKAVRDLVSELEREQTLVGATDTQRRISNALKRAGAAATDEQRQRITDLITAIEAEKEAMEGLEAAQEELRDVARDALGSIVDGLRDGASAGEILSGVLDRLMDRLLDMAIENATASLIGGVGKAGGGTGFLGVLGKLFGFADGGYTGRGGKYEPAGVVHRGEYVLSKAATERLGVTNLDALHQNALRGFSDGGYVGASPAVRRAQMPANGNAAGSVAQTITLSPTVNVNASGGSSEQNSDLARQTAKAVESQMRALIVKEISTQLRPGGIMGRR